MRHQRSNIYQEVTKRTEMRGDAIYPICTIISLGQRYAPRGEGEQRLQKLAQYHHHLAIIHLLQYCVITTSPEEVTWLVMKS